MKKAKEVIGKNINEKAEKSLFVKNFGWLLSQTKEGVTKCEYVPEEDIAKIHYTNGDVIAACVQGSSFKGIIIDILAAMLVKEKENENNK